MELAREQHGVVSRQQLLGRGLSPSAIWRRLRSGRLQPLLRGVYQVGPIPGPRAPDVAALLAAGSDAILSHTSALHLWGLAPERPPEGVHVTVPGSGRRRRAPEAGIVVHRSRQLGGAEQTLEDGLPVTVPLRSIADAASILGSGELERAVARAEREALVTTAQLEGLADAYPRRPGMAALRAVLEAQGEPAFTRSEAERRCLALLRDAGLPRPHPNVSVGPYELDLFWPDLGVALEVDGFQHRGSRSRFEADRRRDSWLRARGIEVLRVTWRQVTREATATAVRVGQALALARARDAALRPVPG